MSALYLDTSALFKRYVEEAESEDVLARIDAAQSIGTALITRVEVAAALAKAVRDSRMELREARAAEQAFVDEWSVFTRIAFTNQVAVSAAELAWSHGLRAYDAVQLAAALAWREAPNDMEEDIVFACFDQDLRRAAKAEGLLVWPREEA